jgi:hypothetical protein
MVRDFRRSIHVPLVGKMTYEKCKELAGIITRTATVSCAAAGMVLTIRGRWVTANYYFGLAIVWDQCRGASIVQNSSNLRR